MKESEFTVGQWVRIVPLGKSGQILELKGKKGCLVEVNGMRLKCSVKDLRPVEKETAKPSRKMKSQNLKPSQKPQAGRQTRKSIDLHGMTRDEAIRAVEQCINYAILDGLDEIEVIHGHGSGVLKQALHEYLSSLSVVRHYSIHPLNTGLTRVIF